MNDDHSGTVGILLLIPLIWFGYAHYQKVQFEKPWWHGTSAQKVCLSDHSETCYTLPVTVDEGLTMSITFPNTGRVYGEAECSEAASYYDFDRFCHFTDQENRGWDVIPL